ncbi:MAG TPA: farnesyl diphosphate synthase [Clostridia bacterium]|nr:farnesyl diphosphate synthase [Clostridia bacterium]
MQNNLDNKYLTLINNALIERMPEDCSIVGRAMRYSIQNGGKRIRPTLTLEFCRICGGKIENALDFACAVEMIHTYSLIHDDLPCMDDDNIRRGEPACHIKFGEEYALLAGDALLTLAFKTLMKCENVSAENKVRACVALSEAAGCNGMVAGQMMDLQNEGKGNNIANVKKTDELKTGALIKVSAILGCIAANASEKQIKAASEYSSNIGLAFQIIDDILDVISDEETLGKPTGSDEENSKYTYVSFLGLDGAKSMAEELTDKAKSALQMFGENSQKLKKFADILAKRRS